MGEISRSDLEKLERLGREFGYFSHNILKIRNKGGKSSRFTLNRAQRYFLERMRIQEARTGRVRIVTVKGRQQGVSTFITGYFFWKSLYEPSLNTFILGHEIGSSSNLFNMVKRYWEQLPDGMKPELTASNAKELIFKLGGGNYRIGTAGKGDSSRGVTMQQFHGSEVAYWPNGDDIQSGVMESVADLDGTRIVLESTANGVGGFFYEKAMEAVSGKSDYEMVFVPWYWQDEYKRDATGIEDELDSDEVRLLERFGTDGLTLEHLAWRRIKLAGYRGRDYLFRQEYPFLLEEAFQRSDNSLVPPHIVEEAKNNTTLHENESNSLVIGVDPARDFDKTAIVWRRGRVLVKYELHEYMRETRLARMLADIIMRDNPAAVFIDAAHGYGTLDCLEDMGIRRAQVVNFGPPADDNEIYQNKRVEMYDRLRTWFMQEGGVKIPDDGLLGMELACIPDIEDALPKKKMMEKKAIREKLGHSPDLADALALTFAYSVYNVDGIGGNGVKSYRPEKVSIRRTRDGN